MIGRFGDCSNDVAGLVERPQEQAEAVDGLSDGTFARSLIDGMRCGILAIDRSGRLRMANSLATQILGIVADPPTGVPIGDVVPDHPQLARVLRDSFDMSSLPSRAELELNPGAVDEKTIGFTVSMIRGENGRAEGAAVFFKDLTPIEHREEQERLKDRLAALGEMAANIAHEIRNPLAAIEVTCGLLKRRMEPDGTGRELLDKITSEVRRLNRVIDSSLESVKPLSPELEHADLVPMLDEAIAVARERGASPRVRFARRFSENLPTFLMDRARLRQVFENLVLNAIEAIGESGIVTVEAEAIPSPRGTSVPYRHGAGARQPDPWQSVDEFAVIRVSDTGPGICESDRQNVFYPFFTTKARGSGVGLAVARKIVEGHRGMIDVDNLPQGGAVFTVRLPMVRCATRT